MFFADYKGNFWFFGWPRALKVVTKGDVAHTHIEMNKKTVKGSFFSVFFTGLDGFIHG